MKKRIIYVAVISLTALITVSAQLTEQEVRQRLDLIHSGKIDQVRTEVSALLKQMPEDAAVRYLEAYVTSNGDHAVKKYQSLVDNFPQSEWADDALYKVYQYYYAVGMYKTADAKLNQLNQQYPNSIFAKNEAKPSEIGIQKPDVQPATQPEAQPVIEEKIEAPAPSADPVEGTFVVQVGVYSQELKAREQAATFTSTVGRQAIVFTKMSGRKTVFAVAFEGFTTEQSAKVFGDQLKARFNLDWFVVKR